MGEKKVDLTVYSDGFLSHYTKREKQNSHTENHILYIFS